MNVGKLRLAAVVLGMLGALTAGSRLARAEELGKQDAAPKDKIVRARADQLDDSVPEHAIARLGSRQWRNLGQWRVSLFFRDNETVVVHDAMKDAQALDFQTGLVRWEVKDLRGQAAMALLPGGQLLIDDNDTARIIDIVSGKEKRRIPIRLNGSEAVVSDGRLLAIHEGFGKNAYAAVVYNLNSGEELWHHGGLMDPNGYCYPVGFVPDKPELVLRTYQHPDWSIRVLDVNTQKTLREWKLPATKPGEYQPGPRLSPDGKLLWAGGYKNVRLWDVATGKEHSTWAGHADDVIQAAFTVDSKRLVTAGKDLTVRWWDVATGKELGKIAFGKRAWTLAVSPDGERAVAVCGGESTLRRFDLKTSRELPLPDGHTNLIEQLAFLPDGSHLLTAGRDGTVRVWDMTTKRTVQTWSPQHLSLNWLSISGDGKLAATAGYNDAIIRVCDIASGKELRSFTPPFHTVGALAFAPTGSTLAAGGYTVNVGEDSIYLWNARSGEQIKKLAGHRFGVGGLSFTPDAQHLISTDGERGLEMGEMTPGQTPGLGPRIWNLTSGRAILLDAHLARFALPSPDSYSVAIIRRHRLFLELCLLEMASGRERLKFSEEGSQMGPLAFSPEGRLLATPGPYPQGQSHRLPGVYLWDTDTGKKRHRFDAGDVWCFAFSPDGKILATGGVDGTVLLWDMTKIRSAAAVTSNVTDETLWADLAADAPRAYQAIVTLSQLGDRGVALLRDRLKPVLSVDPKHIAKLIDDLDDRNFAVRQKATTELSALDDRAGSALRDRLKSTRSDQTRRSIQQLLDDLEGFLTDTNRLREVRAVESLERIDTLSARRLLDELAKGDPAARLTREASAALARKRHEKN